MTMKSSQRLADALRLAGFEMLALKAEKDDFHETFPAMELVSQLSEEIRNTSSVKLKEVGEALRQRIMNGEFDAPREEM